MFWRTSEFHHPPHVVWSLKVEAVDEEQRLLYSSLQQVSVNGYHPTVHGYATPERERERKSETEGERKGSCYSYAKHITYNDILLTGISGLH